jgi:SAM-dependent methyltransferase
MSRCPVCGSHSVEIFLTRTNVPVHINSIMKSREAAVATGRGAVTLGCCRECGFIFNLTFDQSQLHYEKDYDNTQRYSPFFSAYQSHLVDYLISRKGLRNSTIVEVGCGEGLFLRQLVEAEGCGNTGYGFDPAYAGPSVDLDGRLRFENSFFGESSSHLPADAILCRHVLGHVPDPLDFLCGIHEGLSSSRDVPIFVENQSVEWMLRKHSLWDFSYEQCSYFSVHSLTTALECSGFQVTSVRSLFKGQYMWAEARSTTRERDIPRDPEMVTRLVRSYARAEEGIIREMNGKIRMLASSGNIALWGAAAKGVTLANVIDPNAQLISCVVDLNPRKQGGYIAGTGHPIVSYMELPAYSVKSILVMNPNYRDEIGTLLREAGIDIPLIDPYDTT